MKLTERIEALIALVEAKAPVPEIKGGLLKMFEEAEAIDANVADVAAIKKECAEHKAALAELQRQNRGITEEKRAILRILDSKDDPWQPEKIAESLGADASRIRCLLVKLKKEKCVREVLTGFYIEDKGREALHEP